MTLKRRHRVNYQATRVSLTKNSVSFVTSNSSPSLFVVVSELKSKSAIFSSSEKVSFPWSFSLLARQRNSTLQIEGPGLLNNFVQTAVHQQTRLTYKRTLKIYFLSEFQQRQSLVQTNRLMAC